jgi:hypothetical protein
MKRFRIRTLLFLVAIAALIATLLVERQHAARIEAWFQESLAESAGT